jgi:hypothetical protein
MTLGHAIAIAVLAILAGGCASAPTLFDHGKVSDALDDWSCEASQKKGECVAAYMYYLDAAKDKANRPARLLRGHVILVMFTRYAADRFPGMSDDLVNDATRVIGRVETARATLKRLADEADKVDNAYAVERVDGLIELVDVAVAATQPSRRHWFKLAVLSSAADRLSNAPDLIKASLRDALYERAYSEYLEQMRPAPGTNVAELEKKLVELDRELAKYCGALGTLAKLENKTCLPK